MCYHGYFYRGNKKQTRMTLKNINFFTVLNVAFMKVPYTSYIVPSTEPRFFSREGEGRFI